MYICICNAVTEQHIEHAVRNGAKRMRDLRVGLGVASDCARCANCARQCLESALGNQPAACRAETGFEVLTGELSHEMEAS